MSNYTSHEKEVLESYLYSTSNTLKGLKSAVNDLLENFFEQAYADDPTACALDFIVNQPRAYVIEALVLSICRDFENLGLL